jgi:hypothetical protein
MNDAAAGFGNLLCRTALDVGFAGAQIAHCYSAAAHQQLGYSAFALLVLVAVIGFKRLARSA